jgi:siroheme synthase-like protein
MNSEPSNTLAFLPVGLRVEGRSCLVVGGGAVGTRKVLTLARAGAIVTVFSPTITQELADRIDGHRVRWVQAAFHEAHLAGAFLVIAATDDEALNAAVVHAAVQRGALACDASSAERSQIIFGALLESGNVTVAVFTGGRDPAAARRTRDEIAKLLHMGKGPAHPG